MSDSNISPITTVLLKLVATSHAEESLSRELKEAIVRTGSGTEANTACADRIDIGIVAGSGGDSISCAKVKGTDFSVKDLVFELEEIEVPTEIRERLGGVTQDQWEAAVRFVGLLLIELERHGAGTIPHVPDRSSGST